ncbi:hypothetical protein [Streptomyces sp. NPDC057382]|uniref:hypothetical protein n=1 Tax=unclassified Streptomyces TaxID=2593676 RepID=UPI0036288166
MGFDQEWAQVRSGAVEQQAASMRLNRAADEAASGSAAGRSPDQASTPARKRAAANTIETELEPNTGRAATWADTETTTAVTEFAGWAAAEGLKTVQTTWNRQVKTLMGRLAAEKGALKGTARTFGEYELDRRQQFSGLRSDISTY